MKRNPKRTVPASSQVRRSGNRPGSISISASNNEMKGFDMNIKKFAKQQLEKAKKKLRKHGGLEVTARAYDSKGSLVLDTVIDPYNEKRLQQLHFQAQAAQLGCTMVVVVTEGWLARDDGRTFQGIPPSQRPDRQEAVGASVHTPSDSYCIFQVYKRDFEDKITFGETHAHMGGYSAFTDMLWARDKYPVPGIAERGRRAAKEMEA